MLSVQARLARHFLDLKFKKSRNRDHHPLTSRKSLAQGMKHMPVPKGIKIIQTHIGQVPVEIIRDWSATKNSKAMMYIHGGGYLSGSPETHRAFTARLAIELQCEVWVPDYRLAPEHPFPAGLHDVAEVWEAFIKKQSDKTIILGGESAGGGLSLALCYLARERGLRLPDQLYLLSPWLDIRMAGESYKRNDGRDILVSSYYAEHGFARDYAGTHARTDPLMSPLLGDPTGLPPTYVQVSDTEIFEDDSRSFVEKARNAGVNVTFEVGRGLWHAWPLFAPFIPESNQAIKRFGKWVRHF